MPSDNLDERFPSLKNVAPSQRLLHKANSGLRAHFVFIWFQTLFFDHSLDPEPETKHTVQYLQ